MKSSSSGHGVPPVDEPLSAPAAWAEYLAFTSGANESSSLPHRLLVQIARQGELGDPDSCAIVVMLIDTTRELRDTIKKQMSPRGLSQARMATLLTLYAIAPVSSTAADLAFHAGVTRGSMTRILDLLEKRGWLVREASHGDRRFTPVSLTEAGRLATIDAVERFIRLASDLAGPLSLAERQVTVAACERLRRRATEIQNRRDGTPSL